MGLIKLTFDGALNTAKQDAVFNHFLTSGVNGIFKDIGNNCSATISNSRITFKDGYAQAVGRRVYIENNTSLDIQLDKTANGIVVINFNTLTDEATLEIKEKEDAGKTFPTLVQTATITEDGIYELPIFYYRKTASSLTQVTDKSIPYITKVGVGLAELATRISGVESTLISKIESKASELVSKIEGTKSNITIQFVRPSKSTTSGSGVDYTFNIPTSNAYLLSFYLKGNFITIPSEHIATATYAIGINYRSLNQDYTCTVNKGSSAQVISIVTGNKEHQISGIYISY